MTRQPIESLFQADVLLSQDVIFLRPIGWLDVQLPWMENPVWPSINFRGASLWQPSIPDLAWLYAAYALLGMEPPPAHRHHIHSQRARRIRRPIKRGASGGQPFLAPPSFQFNPPNKPSTRRGESPIQGVSTTRRTPQFRRVELFSRPALVDSPNNPVQGGRVVRSPIASPVSLTPSTASLEMPFLSKSAGNLDSSVEERGEGVRKPPQEISLKESSVPSTRLERSKTVVREPLRGSLPLLSKGEQLRWRKEQEKRKAQPDPSIVDLSAAPLVAKQKKPPIGSRRDSIKRDSNAATSVVGSSRPSISRGLGRSSQQKRDGWLAKTTPQSVYVKAESIAANQPERLLPSKPPLTTSSKSIVTKQNRDVVEHKEGEKAQKRELISQSFVSGSTLRRPKPLEPKKKSTTPLTDVEYEDSSSISNEWYEPANEVKSTVWTPPLKWSESPARQLREVVVPPSAVLLQKNETVLPPHTAPLSESETERDSVSSISSKAIGTDTPPAVSSYPNDRVPSSEISRVRRPEASLKSSASIKLKGREALSDAGLPPSTKQREMVQFPLLRSPSPPSKEVFSSSTGTRFMRAPDTRNVVSTKTLPSIFIQSPLPKHFEREIDALPIAAKLQKERVLARYDLKSPIAGEQDEQESSYSVSSRGEGTAVSPQKIQSSLASRLSPDWRFRRVRTPFVTEMTPLSVEMAHAVSPNQLDANSSARLNKTNEVGKAVVGLPRAVDGAQSTKPKTSKSIEERLMRSALDSGRGDETPTLSRPNKSNERFVSLPRRPRWKPEYVATSANQRVDRSQGSSVKPLDGQRRELPAVPWFRPLSKRRLVHTPSTESQGDKFRQKAAIKANEPTRQDVDRVRPAASPWRIKRSFAGGLGHPLQRIQGHLQGEIQRPPTMPLPVSLPVSRLPEASIEERTSPTARSPQSEEGSKLEARPNRSKLRHSLDAPKPTRGLRRDRDTSEESGKSMPFNEPALDDNLHQAAAKRSGFGPVPSLAPGALEKSETIQAALRQPRPSPDLIASTGAYQRSRSPIGVRVWPNLRWTHGGDAERALRLKLPLAFSPPTQTDLIKGAKEQVTVGVESRSPTISPGQPEKRKRPRDYRTLPIVDWTNPYRTSIADPIHAPKPSKHPHLDIVSVQRRLNPVAIPADITLAARPPAAIEAGQDPTAQRAKEVLSSGVNLEKRRQGESDEAVVRTPSSSGRVIVEPAVGTNRRNMIQDTASLTRSRASTASLNRSSQVGLTAGVGTRSVPIVSSLRFLNPPLESSSLRPNQSDVPGSLPASKNIRHDRATQVANPTIKPRKRGVLPSRQTAPRWRLLARDIASIKGVWPSHRGLPSTTQQMSLQELPPPAKGDRESRAGLQRPSGVPQITPLSIGSGRAVESALRQSGVDSQQPMSSTEASLQGRSRSDTSPQTRQLSRQSGDPEARPKRSFFLKHEKSTKQGNIQPTSLFVHPLLADKSPVSFSIPNSVASRVERNSAIALPDKSQSILLEQIVEERKEGRRIGPPEWVSPQVASTGVLLPPYRSNTIPSDSSSSPRQSAGIQRSEERKASPASSKSIKRVKSRAVRLPRSVSWTALTTTKEMALSAVRQSRVDDVGTYETRQKTPPIPSKSVSVHPKSLHHQPSLSVDKRYVISSESESRPSRSNADNNVALSASFGHKTSTDPAKRIQGGAKRSQIPIRRIVGTTGLGASQSILAPRPTGVLPSTQGESAASLPSVAVTDSEALYTASPQSNSVVQRGIQHVSPVSETALLVPSVKKSGGSVALPVSSATPLKKKKRKTKKKKSSKSDSFFFTSDGLYSGTEASQKRLEMGFEDEEESFEEELPAAQSWSAPPEVMANLAKSLKKRLPTKKNKAPQNSAKLKKRLPKRVIGELAEEELFLILQELMEDNPEAEELLKELHLKVEEIRLHDKLREI